MLVYKRILTKYYNFSPQKVDVPQKRFKWNLKEEESMAENQQKKIDRLKIINQAQAHTINVLKEKNASLTLTSASYAQLRLKEQLGERRSAMLIDAALFSNTFHSGDMILQQQEPFFLDESEFKDARVLKLAPGTFSDVKRYFLTETDSVIVKFYSRENFGCQSLAVLSHEHRLLRFLGNHPNIVRTIGLVRIESMLSHVMCYQPGATLQQVISTTGLKSLLTFTEIAEGIAAGLNHLFEKRIIHNHVVPDNVIFHNNTVVIIGFSFACRDENVKTNITKVLQKFSDQKHLAPELFKGSPVSLKSDVFAFGVLLKRLWRTRRSFKLDDILESRVDAFLDMCMYNYEARENPSTLLNRVRSIFKSL